MKKTTKIISLILISIFVTLTIFGCNSSASATDPQIRYPLLYEIKSDKTKCDLGEEIEIEFLFNVNVDGISRKDEKTYSVKLAESSYYEIIGDSIISVDASENSQQIKGKYSDYWYRAVFKIKITEEASETQKLVFYVKCVEDDWLNYIHDETKMYESDDPEYQLRIETLNGFKTNSDGVEFSEILDQEGQITNKTTLFVIKIEEMFNGIKFFFKSLLESIIGIFS